MKIIVLYISFFLCLIACKNSEKSSSDILISTKDSSELVNKEVKNALLKQDSVKGLREKLIGKTYTDLKEIEEFKEYNSGGATIGDDFNGKTYMFSSVRGVKDIAKYVLLEESLNSKFKIVDILDLTKEDVLYDEDYNLYYHFCYKDGKNDQEIIAIAKYEEEEFLTKIVKAWRADLKNEKIIEIPIDGITVSNEEYGL